MASEANLNFSRIQGTLSTSSYNERQQLIDVLLQGYDKARADEARLSYSNRAAQLLAMAAEDTFHIDQEGFRQFKQLESVALDAGFIKQAAQIPVTLKNMAVEKMQANAENPLQAMPMSQVALDLIMRTQNADLKSDIQNAANAVKNLVATPEQVWNHERGIYTDADRDVLAKIYSADTPESRLEALQRFRSGDVTAAVNLALAASVFAKVKSPDLPFGGSAQAITPEGFAIEAPASQASAASGSVTLPLGLGVVASAANGSEGSDNAPKNAQLQEAHQKLEKLFDGLSEEHKAVLRSNATDLETQTRQQLLDKTLRGLVGDIAESAFPEGLDKANLQDVTALMDDAKNRMMRAKGLVAEEAEITRFQTPDLRKPQYHDVWATIVAKSPEGKVDIFIASNELNPEIHKTFYEPITADNILNSSLKNNIADLDGFKEATGFARVSTLDFLEEEGLGKADNLTMAAAATRTQLQIKNELQSMLQGAGNGDAKGLREAMNREVQKYMGNLGSAEVDTIHNFKITPAGIAKDFDNFRAGINKLGYDIDMADYNNVFATKNMTAKLTDNIALMSTKAVDERIASSIEALNDLKIPKGVYYPSSDVKYSNISNSDGFEP